MIDFKTVTTPTFGPGGNGEWFKNEGGKATVQAPGWLKSKGLDAYEYEAGKGIMAGEGALLAIGQKALEHGILMSLHAPYFISLSSVEEEKRVNSIGYIQKSLWAAELLGAAEIAVSIAAGVVAGQLLASRLMPYFRRSGIAYTPAISSPFTTMRRRRLSLGSRRVRRRRGAPVIEPSTMTGEMTALSSTMFEDPSFLEDLEPPSEQESTSGRRTDREE